MRQLITGKWSLANHHHTMIDIMNCVLDGQWVMVSNCRIIQNPSKPRQEEYKRNA